MFQSFRYFDSVNFALYSAVKQQKLEKFSRRLKKGGLCMKLGQVVAELFTGLTITTLRVFRIVSDINPWNYRDLPTILMHENYKN